MIAKQPGANGALSQFDAAWSKCGHFIRRRSSEAALKQLEKMECRLDATFPLWPPNVEKLIDNPEDLAFLASMKTDRVATFGALDKKLQLKVKRREEHHAATAATQSRCEKELKEKMEMFTLVSESDEDDSNTVCPPSDSSLHCNTSLSGPTTALVWVSTLHR